MGVAPLLPDDRFWETNSGNATCFNIKHAIDDIDNYLPPPSSSGNNVARDLGRMHRGGWLGQRIKCATVLLCAQLGLEPPLWRILRSRNLAFWVCTGFVG